MRMVAASSGGLTVQVDRLGLGLAAIPALMQFMNVKMKYNNCCKKHLLHHLFYFILHVRIA